MSYKQKEAVKDEIPGQQTTPLILLFLLLSGSCGLIYEIVWMKMLTLVIGNTVFSITTVLTAFMGGLALGSFLAGRLESRIEQPLKIYGLLEGGIGLYALLLPFLIAGAEPLIRFVYQGLNPSFYTMGLLRFLVCGILLLVPTTLMGATLPVLSRYFVAGHKNLGRSVGLLYGLNTFGAVLGCSLAGFILIPELGVTWTIYGAALLNLAICAGVLKLANDPVPRKERCEIKAKSKGKKQQELQRKQRKQQMQRQPQKQSAEEIVPQVQPAVARAVMAGIGLSGLAAMIYQIAWTRVLLLSIGPSVYAFSLIVTAFICGLALGSLSMAKFIDRRQNLLLWLGLVQAAIGISALLIVPVLGKLPVFVAEYLFTSLHSFKYIHVTQFAVIFALILIPTFMMGAAVPLAVKICTTDARRVATFFGSVYAVNTLGAIIGSFSAGFFLIPWLGTQTSIMVAVALNISAAGIILLHTPGNAFPIRCASALVPALLAVLIWLPIPQWDAAILASGPYLYADDYRDTSARKGIDFGSAMKEKHQLLYFKEGLHALVSVVKSAQGDVLLRVNGKTDASSKGGDVATQLMVGHLPLLLHQGAQDVLVIGLGSGMTLRAVENHPVNAVDVVEIEAAVVEASEHFRDFTGNPLDDDRVSLIVADGRNHLALTDRQYDVIISEPSNPWVAGMANLFTREFFALAKQRLRKEGLMCQWVHANAMSSMDFRTIVHTFRTVFPHVTLWEAAFGADYLLIGTPQKSKFDYPALLNRLGDERLKTDLAKIRIGNPAAFLDKLVITDTAVADYAREAPLHTDGNARLDYSAPRALFQAPSTRLLEALYRFHSAPADKLAPLEGIENAAAMEKDLSGLFQAKNLIVGGFTRYAGGAAREAITKFEAALALSPTSYDATELLAKLNYEIGSHFKDARRPAQASRAYDKSIEAITGFIKEDRARLTDHFDLASIYARANLDLGTLALKENRLEQAKALFKKSIAADVQYAQAHNNLGIVYERTGKYDAAITQYRYAIELNPNLVSAHMNMGNTRLKQKQYQAAIQSYRYAQKLRPDFAIAHFNLGAAYFQQNEWFRAEKEWERALALKPDFTQARKSLDTVRKKIRPQ